jgi:hypothetical protein
MAGDLAFVGSLLVLHLVSCSAPTQNPNPPHLLACCARAASGHAAAAPAKEGDECAALSLFLQGAAT